MQKKENLARIIFHIDMNQFFCSVAQILDPSLKGTAFAIGRENTTKGVLSTASYEARKYGIHSAMATSEAYKLLPSLRVISIDYKYYKYYHYKFIDVVKEYTDQIEVASIDEVYADMTEISKKIHPTIIAKEIQLKLLKEYKLPCSIGIAPTLFLAKMASDLKKPLGLTILRKKDIKDILYPLSVKEIFGIGKKTYPRLIENNINTIADFMNPDNKELILKLIGSNTYNYAYNSLTGNSSNKVDPDRWSDSQSISEVRTYDQPKGSLDEALYEIRLIFKEVYNKMKKQSYYTKTVNITLRDTIFKTITRQKTLDEYTDDYYLLLDETLDLVEENFEDKEYRLLGCGLSNLVSPENLPKEYNLFTILTDDEKLNNIDNLMEELQSKYGKKALFWNKTSK